MFPVTSDSGVSRSSLELEVVELERCADLDDSVGRGGPLMMSKRASNYWSCSGWHRIRC